MNHKPQGGRIFQINISAGGVPKLAVPCGEVTELGIQGDQQADRRVHGGPDRAVCLYSLERLLMFQAEGHPIFAGALGENLTLSGLDWTQIEPGQRFRLGDQALIEITRYTTPCNNLVPFFKDGEYGRISQSQNPGWSRVYGRVLVGGMLHPGDPVIQILF